MDEDLKFGIVGTVTICSVGYVLGGIGGLLASLAFCSIPWAYEIRDMRRTPEIEILKCELCDCKFKIKNKMMEYEHRKLGNICPLCLNSIFQYSKREPCELETK